MYFENKLDELMYQSGLTAQGCWDEMDQYDREAIKRYAQMIVRECANQCTTEGPFVAEVVWGKQFHKKILEHFGVKE